LIVSLNLAASKFLSGAAGALPRLPSAAADAAAIPPARSTPPANRQKFVHPKTNFPKTFGIMHLTK
jgi:hypothetical protein